MKSPNVEGAILAFEIQKEVVIWTQFINEPIYSAQTNKYLPSYKNRAVVS